MYIQSIKTKLFDFCQHLLNLIDNKLLVNYPNIEYLILVTRTKGDLTRYLCEIASNDKEREKYLISANKTYQLAENMCMKNLSVIEKKNTSVVIALIANYSLFLHDYYNQHELAIEKAVNYYNRFIDSDGIKDLLVYPLLSILKNNIEQWKQTEISLQSNIHRIHSLGCMTCKYFKIQI